MSEDRRTSKFRRRAAAEKVLARAKFVPEKPIGVVPFAGGLIGQGRAAHVIDYHVVDARGRTLAVSTQEQWSRVRERRKRAEWIARELNAL